MTENLPTPAPEPAGQIILYQSPDGTTRIEVRLEGETVWLPQRLIAELFQVSVPTVNEHLKGIYDEGELDPRATIRNFRIVQTEGQRQISRHVDHYNLDAILAVGYRVRSPRGTQFRIWATERLREYLIKGFTMDDERLKRAGGGNYFEELLARIRDIRFLRAGLLAQGPRHLRHEHRLRSRGRAIAAVLQRPCRTRCTGRRTATRRPR